MSIAESFYTFLSNNGTITAATSSIYPQMLPQTNPGLPALTFSQDGEEDQAMLDGAPNELKQALFSVECWSASYKTAHDLAEIVKGELIAITGTFGTHTADHIRKEREIDIFESDTRYHRVSLQFLVAYY